MIVLLVHFTSSSLEATLVRLNKNSKPQAFFSQTFALHENLKSFGSEANKKLSATKEKIEKIFCIFNPPFFQSTTKIVSNTEKEPIKIDDNYIRKLIGPLNQTFEIENEIIHISLNGYPISNPEGKIAKSIELMIYQSFTSKETIQEIRENVLPIFRKMIFHTFPYVIFKVLTFLKPHQDSFFVINLEKNYSSLIAFQRGLYFQRENIETGYENFQKRIEEVLSVDRTASTSLLKMYVEDSLDQNTKEKIQAALKPFFEEWYKKINENILKISQSIQFSSNFYLIAPDHWFSLVENISKDSNILTGQINFQDLSEIVSLVSFDNTIESASMMALDCLFANNFLI